MQKIEPTFLNILKADQHAAGSEKLHPCIVYTTDAEKVRSKGIIVRSVLPTFITANATFLQIIEICKMKEVTYIEAPDTLELHEP